ncbi:hypothetical protein AVEN_165302-1 [Araneus ventricosus]|uniref:Uncharacterized protein n=1 Tax=Araneus ventricosus TaxID=182803 RepID=A0A4Y2AV65_ARAVE|nr:hypothetical protein AVEN_165302-1 [Araneus ventricosus]
MIPSGPFSSRGPRRALGDKQREGKLLKTAADLHSVERFDENGLLTRCAEKICQVTRRGVASGPIQTNRKSLTKRVARGLSDRGSEP